jgi:hypothetical protein
MSPEEGRETSRVDGRSIDDGRDTDDGREPDDGRE